VAKRVEIEAVRTLEDHARYVHIAPAVDALRREAEDVARALDGRTVWMINSTAQGGGVSEMLPGMIAHLRELGIATEWAVIESGDPAFFKLTKRIHNLLHGGGEPGLGQADRELYEAVNAANAEHLLDFIDDGDVLVVHDPQPLPLARMLSRERRLTAIWRCHIGLDEVTPQTRDAWSFLEPYTEDYAWSIFSAPEYVPPFLASKSVIIYPAVDPLTAKNRPLSVQTVVAILERSGLLREPGPAVEPRFAHTAARLQADGELGTAVEPDDLGLLTRPIVTQVSRWDRLKGFLPLMHGFARFKQRVAAEAAGNGVSADKRRLQLARLVLAGPDPESIADDPEGVEVLDELRCAYAQLDPAVREDVAIIALPMADLEQNALIVNALQRVSTIVVQNSLREGFGLTITEAMLKSVPILSNSRACGPRQQVRDRRDGRLLEDPEDVEAIGSVLHEMLGAPALLDAWGLNAEQQVHERFLVHVQLTEWLRLLSRAVVEPVS
jgi:trehalose synthase